MFSVLYVDDEPGLLEVGKLYLERKGEFVVETVTSAQDALVMIEKGNYDAIVSDYQMPVMNGIDFLKQVRASGNSIPFIIFTGRGREEVVIQALNEGADFYLQKGGEPGSQFAELAHKVRQAVQQRRAEVSIRDHERREAGYPELPSGRDICNRHEGCGDRMEPVHREDDRGEGRRNSGEG